MITLLQILSFLQVLTLSLASPVLLPKLSQAEWASYYDTNHKGEGTYSFGYDIEDAPTGNIQYRQEERHNNGTVTGSYGLVEPDGNVRIVRYVADPLTGYRVTVENRVNKEHFFPPGVTKYLTEKPVYEPEDLVTNRFHSQGIHEQRLPPAILYKPYLRTPPVYNPYWKVYYQ